jgi:pyruvate formate lyase activating enzyme
MPDRPDGKIKIVCDWDKCTDCGSCEQACLPKALYYCGIDYTIDELMPRIKREKPFYDKSGGGVTVSGGECLCQADAVAELLKSCKEIGVDTVVDTCGFIPFKNIEKVLPYVDLFLYDLKHMDSNKHKEGTGVPNELILENAVKITERGGKFHIRVPLIPGFNTDFANIEAICNFLTPIKHAVELVQVLPFHNLGSAKYDRLSKQAPRLETHPPTDEEIAAIVKIFEDFDFKVVIH